MGKSYAHPLLMLVTQPNQSERSRFAVSAGRAVGKAVERNRAKRLIRASILSILESIKPGWDIVLLARRPMAKASFQETCQALANLCERAGLMVGNHGN